MPKRKGSKRSATTTQAARPEFDPSKSKLNVSTYEDVAGSDDEFHLSRDKILLDELPEAKRRRKIAERDAFLEQSDDEVLGYHSASDDDELGSGGSEIFDDDDDDDDGIDPLDAKVMSREAKKKLREGLGARDADDDDEDDDDETWGTRPSAYYGADTIETEQDAVDELAEATRLRKKQTQTFGLSGFGLDEAEWAADGGEEAEDPAAATTVVVKDVSDLVVPRTMSPTDRLDLIRARFPEFDDLAAEIGSLQSVHEGLTEEVAELGKGSDQVSLTLRQAKLRAVSAYLGSLCLYFAILTSPAAAAASADESSDHLPLAKAPGDMHNHPIMTSLVRCRETWYKLKDIEVEPAESDEGLDDEEEIDSDVDMLLPELSEGESAEIEIESDVEPTPKPKKSRAAKKLEKAAKAAALEAKAEKSKKISSALSTLDAALGRNTAKKDGQTGKSIAMLGEEDESDLGEPDQLTSGQLSEKAKRRRSVRFHMSQIHQREAKAARGAANDGDLDIPYRERWRDRVERLNKEAEARGRKAAVGREALGGSDSEGDDEPQPAGRENRPPGGADGDSDEDDYYDMVAASREQKLRKKAEAAAGLAEAAKAGKVVPVEEIGPDGKRKITYQIEKNRGLTPSRRKAIKNPRVKKRLKFEQKMKKLKTVKAVYSGGEQKSGYSGERTGIKAGLIRSRKL